MESQKSQSIARRGSVQIKNSNGSLQLVLFSSYCYADGRAKNQAFLPFDKALRYTFRKTSSIDFSGNNPEGY
ncbi:hypothetical protein [uncultured Nostoc sp.]|uniref:hypothetical protein n=1 Tax=uncultured Nostoc sp. TaxID=340711 RepID=UPI0035C99638